MSGGEVVSGTWATASWSSLQEARTAFLARRISSKDAPSATPSSFSAPSTVISNGAGEESSAREAARRGGLHRERGNAQHRPAAAAVYPRRRGVPPQPPRPPPPRERAVAVAILSLWLRSLGASSLACVRCCCVRRLLPSRMIFFRGGGFGPVGRGVFGHFLGFFSSGRVWNLDKLPGSKTGFLFQPF